MTALLDVERLAVRYGDLVALSDIDLSVAEGQTLAVLGANGAGKSTLLKAITGLLPARTGRVRFAGADLAGTSAPRRVASGISMVPEGRRLFASLTVEENLLVGARVKRAGHWTLRSVYSAFPLVAGIRLRRAGDLSGGEQQATAIARALMSNPRLVLLDEVSLGLAPLVVKQLYAILPQITAAGTTVLLVEQDVRQALAVADHVHCLLGGRTALSAPAAQVTPADVAAVYFGRTGGVDPAGGGAPT